VNWEAFWVIGAICAALGVVLYVPAHWWFKRRVRSLPPDSSARLHVTSAGLAFCVLVLGLMLAGISQLYFAPETEFARFLASGIGLIVFFTALVLLGGVIGVVLESFGLALFRRPSGNRK